MDTVFQALLSWQFLLACLSIAGITYILRTTFEYFMQESAFLKNKTKLWNDLILPLFPMIFGTIAALIAKGYPYPQGMNTASGRAAFGMVAGLLSGLIYRVLKAFLLNKVGQSSDDCSPPASDALINQVRDSINKN